MSKTRRNTGTRKQVKRSYVKDRTNSHRISYPIRLNRFIAHSGICSRRQADELIGNGEIMVNSKVITTMGFQVQKGDMVLHKKKKLELDKPVYVLLNKPKDFITTTKDPGKRKTVMDLVKKVSTERIYPVGRLDRNTTGLLLLTNDGDLAKKLTHPSHGVAKIYHVHVDKSLAQNDASLIVDGVELDDGVVAADKLEILDKNRQELGLEIHSGKNRVVRRMFSQLGYDITKLDRVVFGGLTKKNLPRGKWRYLTPREVAALKKIK